MPTDVIPAHSLAEAFLYVLVTPCDVCLHGARQPSLAGGGAEGTVRIMAVCDNCGASDAYRVVAAETNRIADPLSAGEPLNPGGERSQLIDVVQWVTLSEMLTEAAEATPDPGERRWRRHRVRECLDEALRFYDDDSEVPPTDAFFVDASRHSFRRHPHRYARQRLLALRDRLPHAASPASKSSSADAPPRRRWWKFWSA